MSTQPRLVEVRQNVLKQNDLLARSLRERFRAAGVCVISLVSSPGSGKTAFLEKVLTWLTRVPRRRSVGDLATESDAARLARSGAPVKQILPARSVTWTLRWSKRPRRMEVWTNWIFCSLKTSATCLSLKLRPWRNLRIVSALCDRRRG